MKKVRYRRKKQKKILIIGSMCLLLFLCVGYAAFSTNLSLKAKGNIKEHTDFYVSANGSDVTGYGTKTKPYATIEKAYDSAPAKANIYVMTDLKISETILFDQNKNITLKSETGNYKLTRGNMKGYILKITSGETNISNLTFDGENKEAQGGLLRSEGTENNIVSLTLGENAIFQNNIDFEDYGGGASMQFSNVIIDGAKFLNNNANAGGGGGFITKDSTVTINYAEIISNEAINGGGFFSLRDIVVINDINIKNNSAAMGGGINLSSSTLTMHNGEISSNVATNRGGGIIVGRLFNLLEHPISNLTIYNGTITANNATKGGGGIAIDDTCTFSNQTAAIQNNIPDNIGYFNRTEI